MSTELSMDELFSGKGEELSIDSLFTEAEDVSLDDLFKETTEEVVEQPTDDGLFSDFNDWYSDTWLGKQDKQATDAFVHTMNKSLNNAMETFGLDPFYSDEEMAAMPTGEGFSGGLGALGATWLPELAGAKAGAVGGGMLAGPPGAVIGAALGSLGTAFATADPEDESLTQTFGFGEKHEGELMQKARIAAEEASLAGIAGKLTDFISPYISKSNREKLKAAFEGPDKAPKTKEGKDAKRVWNTLLSSIDSDSFSMEALSKGNYSVSPEKLSEIGATKFNPWKGISEERAGSTSSTAARDLSSILGLKKPTKSSQIHRGVSIPLAQATGAEFGASSEEEEDYDSAFVAMLRFLADTLEGEEIKE